MSKKKKKRFCNLKIWTASKLKVNFIKKNKSKNCIMRFLINFSENKLFLVGTFTCNVATTQSTSLLQSMPRMHFLTKSKGPPGSIYLLVDSWKRRQFKFSHPIQRICKLQVFICVFHIEEEIWQSQIKVNTAVRRAFLLYYKEKKPLCGQKIQDWSFFSSYETLLFKQPEWIVSVHVLKSHHIHLGMDVLGCWKSGPLVHRATKSPDQQFQNVPFSYIASMHTS